MLTTVLLTSSRDEKFFTISEVAADWHELMLPQHTMRPSVARISEQLDPGFAASRHTTVTQCPIAQRLLLISHPAEDRRLS